MRLKHQVLKLAAFRMSLCLLEYDEGKKKPELVLLDIIFALEKTVSVS